METHWGKQVWLSRKGAIDASAGTPGLIPGSMGTRSSVVSGKGNRLVLNSSPHGAGRESTSRVTEPPGDHAGHIHSARPGCGERSALPGGGKCLRSVNACGVGPFSRSWRIRSSASLGVGMWPRGTNHSAV